MTVVIASDGETVAGIRFGSAAASPGLPDETERDPAQPLLHQATSQLAAYAAGERLIFDLPVKPHRTELQTTVWSAPQEIPHGETSTYGKVAAGADGSLTGFAGGLDNKAALLARESVVL